MRRTLSFIGSIAKHFFINKLRMVYMLVFCNLSLYILRANKISPGGRNDRILLMFLGNFKSAFFRAIGFGAVANSVIASEAQQSQ